MNSSAASLVEKNRLVLFPVSVSEAGIWTRQLFLAG
jgi:hypothetical protein